jgi:hypothetical protein
MPVQQLRVARHSNWRQWLVLLAILTQHLIALCLAVWAIVTIDNLHRAFLYTGTDVCASGKYLIAKSIMCLPRILGGLGLIDLRRFNIALQLRLVVSAKAMSSLSSPLSVSISEEARLWDQAGFCQLSLLLPMLVSYLSLVALFPWALVTSLLCICA